ncbi:MAG TPA: RdgB/HAM1 family non-canonical purine NTP pyrophosphatase [Gammaproteobacteria bacterium]|nr:RdgB/HAM1 family non-canonical purine NTP pyrophosphatase [Gammaproteobacteria bacterium]
MAERTLVLATGNAGKLRELAALLEGCGAILRSQSELAVPEAAETGLSFVENALIKARNAARHTGLPAIADDSGLVCDALAGAPGIHSARYAGFDATDAANLDKLLAALAAVPEAARGGRFVCVMVYLAHAEDPCPLIAQGRWEGRIARAPRGTRGFGYDPVFIAAGGHYTAAELDPALKSEVSHRGQALRALVAQLREAEAWR